MNEGGLYLNTVDFVVKEKNDKSEINSGGFG